MEWVGRECIVEWWRTQCAVGRQGVHCGVVENTVWSGVGRPTMNCVAVNEMTRTNLPPPPSLSLVSLTDLFSDRGAVLSIRLLPT